MDLARYRDLFLSEARDYLRALGRGLLELEGAGGGAPLEEAFRAAHTLKGMAATLGLETVARLAHELEDRLAEVRAGQRAVDAALVDELLAQADRLEHAVEAVPLGRDGEPDGAGSGVAVEVLLRADAPLRAARALLVRRHLERLAPVLRMEPEGAAAETATRFVYLLGPGADPAALEAAARAAGEVEAVTVRVAGSDGAGAPAATAARATEPARPRTRHVRIEARHLDELAYAAGEVAATAAQLDDLVAGRQWAAASAAAGRLVRLVRELQDTVLATRMVPAAEVLDRFPRVVRDSARELGKEVEFRIEGREIELDRSVLEAVAEPLVHLLRNAIDHGLEPPAERRAAGKPERGLLLLQVSRERSVVHIRVEDDGRGIPRERVAERARALGIPVPAGELSDEELLRILTRPGFSTAQQVTGLSGRGVGLDVVATTLRRVGGALELRTAAGRGTSFLLRLPVTLAVAQALRVRVGGEEYAIPLTHVAEAVLLHPGQLGRVRGREVLRLREEVLPLVRLRSILGVPGGGAEGAAVVAEVGERRAALAVDELVGREQIVVKGFDAPVGMLPYFSGATVLADGRPALVLDPTSVF